MRTIRKVVSNVRNMMLLSIITVCRNDAARLKKTIDSLSGFYGDQRFEHVVVDGESIDETDALVSSLLKEENFKFYSGRDSGIYDAMNHGAVCSKAPLLLFLNCGDIMMASPDELFACLHPLVASNNAADLDIACFPVQQLGPYGRKTLVPGRLMQHKMPVSHQGMVFARSFVLLKKYQASYKIAGDYDLYLQAERVGMLTSATSRPLVGVEVEGVASSNPLKAYREYLSIASTRLQGWTKLIVMLRIGIRALSVITMKAIIPRRWVSKLRGV